MSVEFVGKFWREMGASRGVDCFRTSAQAGEVYAEGQRFIRAHLVLSQESCRHAACACVSAGLFQAWQVTVDHSTKDPRDLPAQHTGWRRCSLRPLGIY